MKKVLSLAMAAVMAWLPSHAEKRIVGGDISLLPEYESAGAIYNDHDGKPIAELLPWCKEQGMNAMRVRLFVNPKKFQATYPDKYDPNACQDMEYILPLCKRIQEAGLELLLDFHYSDTWADPGAQWTPIEWEGLSDEQLYQKIYDYTKESLETLKANGVVPEYIQTGNEITYGMCWGKYGTSNPLKVYKGNEANWERFCTLLKQAGKACKEVCPDAEIMLHVERVPNPDVMVNFYSQMAKYGVEYDIIGLSYYAFWHGNMNDLNNALKQLTSNFPDKQIQIAETNYALHWAVPGTTIDQTHIWPYTEAGQAKFVTDLIAELEKFPACNGIYWWWMEYNPYNTDLKGWYNAPLFDPNTGNATQALLDLCKFSGENGIDNITTTPATAEPEVWYDLTGRRVNKPSTPGIYVTKGKKVRL